jgi:cytochrome c oxidase assembly protein subunit 11
VSASGKKRTVWWLTGVLAVMVALVAISPELYRTFCSLTGFGGTPLRAETAPGAVPGQVLVRFDANVHPGLPWRFEPEQNTVSVAPGAKTKIFYRATNLSARTIRAQAAYNVSPDQVGKYFKKIQCFCFTEQTLKPGQTVDMPVIFFVDPKFTRDDDTRQVHEITLSYTFYPVETVTAAR